MRVAEYNDEALGSRASGLWFAHQQVIVVPVPQPLDVEVEDEGARGDDA